jgi:hypothetical protein
VKLTLDFNSDLLRVALNDRLRVRLVSSVADDGRPDGGGYDRAALGSSAALAGCASVLRRPSLPSPLLHPPSCIVASASWLLFV